MRLALYMLSNLYPLATALPRPDLERRLAQYLIFRAFTQRERSKLGQVLLDLGNTWPRPVGAEQRFVRDLFQPRKILQKRFGRDAADVQIDVAVSAHQKEGSVHPQRTPAVRQ